jgi:hypothetical protein
MQGFWGTAASQGSLSQKGAASHILSTWGACTSPGGDIGQAADISVRKHSMRRKEKTNRHRQFSYLDLPLDHRFGSLPTANSEVVHEGSRIEDPTPSFYMSTPSLSGTHPSPATRSALPLAFRFRQLWMLGRSGWGEADRIIGVSRDVTVNYNVRALYFGQP